MKTTMMILVLVSLAMISVGCGSSGAAETPKGTLQNAAEALKSGDGAKYASCFKANEHGRRALEAFGGFAPEEKRFSRVLEDAYGTSGSISSDSNKLVYRYLSAEVKIEGNEAKGKYGRPKLVKEDDVWLIVESQYVEMSELQADQTELMVRLSKEMISEMEGLVGADDHPLKVFQEKMRALMEKKAEAWAKENKDEIEAKAKAHEEEMKRKHEEMRKAHEAAADDEEH
ncbi:MAG: hypothetical protein HN909_03905 [Phycisphaerales bacterium]|nr:hypothetical protein [Phycisphaerales bacterium]MBT7170897.1 hypothetical protein [Phycisphaerales bacterium]